MNEPSPPDVVSAPLAVDIGITARCNLHCKYCYYADEMAAANDLPLERWLPFFEELGQLAVQHVYVTGGEPLARPDIFELIDGITANRMRYALLTNGTLLTEKVLAQFDVGKRRRRLDYIQVSVDGSRAEIHDKNRPNSFEHAIHGLRLLVEAGFQTAARVTITQHNVDDLDNIAHLLLEDIGLESFSCNEAFPCGITERQSEDVILTPSQRQRAMQTLTRLADQYEGRIVAAAGPLALARHFRKIEEALERGQTGFPGYGTLSSCSCAFSKISVNPDGSYVPCHQLSTLHLGTIGVDRLQQIWLEHPTLVAMRRRYTTPLQTLDTCRDCPYQGFCGGGCPGLALFLTGELNARNPFACYRVHKGEDPYYRLDE
jgi:SynChlorMet cassette radical SAM/SPASM protein ScmE